MGKREWKTRLAGVTFAGRQENIEHHARNNSIYKLIREPHNRFDINAIMVTANGREIGYIPKHLADELAPLIDAGVMLKVHFLRKLIDDKAVKPTGMLVRIWEA